MVLLVLFVPSIKIEKKYIICIFLSVFLSLLFFLFVPYECPFHEYFHIWCAGCGGTRMIKSIFHLDFYQAFRYNPFLFVILIFGLCYFLIMIFIYRKKNVFVIPSFQTCIIFIVLLIIYMILRNISIFSYLIPTEV